MALGFLHPFDGVCLFGSWIIPCSTTQFNKDKVFSHVGDKSRRSSFAQQRKCMYIYSSFARLSKNISSGNRCRFFSKMPYNFLFQCFRVKTEKHRENHKYTFIFENNSGLGSAWAFWRHYISEYSCWCPLRYIYKAKYKIFMWNYKY